MQKKFVVKLVAAGLAVACAPWVQAQVYSPQITKVGQVDSSNMASLVQGIYQQYQRHHRPGKS